MHYRIIRIKRGGFYSVNNGFTEGIEVAVESGATDSGWVTNRVYNDTGLNASTQYTYTVQMRDSVPDTGTASSSANATTDSASPNVWPSKSTYNGNEDIVVYFENAEGNTWDWVGLCVKDSSDTSYVEWLYTDGTQSGTANIINDNEVHIHQSPDELKACGE